jgi:hypothetical protein
MGVNYLVSPLDPPMLDWARQCGVPTDGVTATGRAATFDELLEITKEISGHSCTPNCQPDGFDIKVESEKLVVFQVSVPWRFSNTVAPGWAKGPATQTQIMGGFDSTREIKWMSFRGDLGLLVAIVRKLTITCGPQTLFADFEGIPWLVLSADAVPLGPEPWRYELPDFGSF